MELYSLGTELNKLFQREGSEFLQNKPSVFYQGFLPPTTADIIQLMSQSTLPYILSYTHHWAVAVHKIQGKYRWLRLRPVYARGHVLQNQHREERGLTLGKSKGHKGLLWGKTYPLISFELLLFVFLLSVHEKTFGELQVARKLEMHVPADLFFPFLICYWCIKIAWLYGWGCVE